jgi:uncharacterized protein with FMN-binding domain
LDLFGIPGAVIIQGGAVGVLVFVVLAILVGRLVPRKSLEDVRADRDARLAREEKRGDEWRAAALAQEQRNDVQARQLDLLLEATRTTNALVEGLKQASQERRR